MKITDYYYGNGLTREEFETDKAQLDGFHPVENDWKELFRWVMSCAQEVPYPDEAGRSSGNIGDVWKNHVLTVLVEILQKDLEDYKNSFVGGRGTMLQNFYIRDLYYKIIAWINRLETYLFERRKEGYTDTVPEIQAALLIQKKLKDSLPEDGMRTEIPVSSSVCKEVYYKMINVLADISREGDRYIGMIEEGGYMDGSLALLLTYVRHYGRVAESFNRKMDALPDYYRRQVLQVTPQEAVQDHTFLVLQAAKNAGRFVLPRGTAFVAGTKPDGTDLLYYTSQDEDILPLKLEETYSIFLKNKQDDTVDICQHPIEFVDSPFAIPLFPEDEVCLGLTCGWMVESRMLVLNEGVRKVKIGFRITQETIPLLPSDWKSRLENSFSLLLSDEEGWGWYVCELEEKKIAGRFFLQFSFTIGEEAALPAACTEELHDTVTDYPAVRILIDTQACPYDLLTRLRFDAVRIETDVTGIKDFTFSNELGEIDTTQPFYPFGTQPGQGAWFMFGNREMGMKHLTKVWMEGKWKKLPPEGYTKLYEAYSCHPPVTDESFLIHTEYQKDREWNPCLNDRVQLFEKNPGSQTLKENVRIDFLFQSMTASEDYPYSCDCNGFFRVTLQEPVIGFGQDAYREVFLDTMIYNSRQKEKHQRPLPTVPVIPMLADVELSYEAFEQLELTRAENSSIYVSHIAPLAEDKTYPLDGKETQAFLPMVEDDHQLYFGFSRATDLPFVQLYFDLGLSGLDLPQQNPEAKPAMVWEYWERNAWVTLSGKALVREETYGFTQSGFVRLNFPQPVNKAPEDKFWLRVRLQGDVRSCLAVRHIWINCIPVTADGGDGNPLPAGTIREMTETDSRIESIVQPMSGFGGKPAETIAATSVRQSYRIAHRHRAVLPADYESMIIEAFPEVEKASCFSFPGQENAQDVKVVVFCRAEETSYFITPPWKLTEMKRYLSPYISSFVALEVINPVYSPVNVSCAAKLKSLTTDKEKVTAHLRYIVVNYLAPWIRKKTLPDLDQAYSYQELHARLANHEDIELMKKLEVVFNEKKWCGDEGETDIFYRTMESPWMIIIPGEISIELLPPYYGVDEGKIGIDFKIG